MCILSSSKKKPFLSDSKFLKHKGFKVCDETDHGIQLWYLPFEENMNMPQFKKCAKYDHVDESGFVLYYTNQCPFNAKYVPLMKNIAKENSIPFKVIHLKSKIEAQNAPTPITTYALFLNGKFITNETLNEKRFLKLLQEYKL